MHIAIDALLLKNENTGTGFYTHHLLCEMAKFPVANRMTVFVDAAYHRAHEFESPSLQVIKIPLRGMLHRLIWEQLWLPHRLKAIHADVVLYPFFIKPLWSRIPAVVVIHDALIKVYPKLISPFRRLYLDYFISGSIQQAARVITVSEYAKSDLMKFYHLPDQMISIARAAPADHVSKFLSAADRQAVLNKCQIPFDSFFLTVGTLSRHKNYLEALRSFKDALAFEPNLKLVMIGGGGDAASEITGFIKAHDLQAHIIWAKYVASEDMPAFYASARALVMTSHYEAFGMPIVEAMQYGIPVIAANRAAIPETMGDAGIVYQTPQELTAAMLLVWSDDLLRADWREKGLQQAIKFNWQQTAQSMMNVLCEVADER
jgi:glycosyltransferase involved in cell wall biosynthesis